MNIKFDKWTVLELVAGIGGIILTALCHSISSSKTDEMLDDAVERALEKRM